MKKRADRLNPSAKSYLQIMSTIQHSLEEVAEFDDEGYVNLIDAGIYAFTPAFIWVKYRTGQAVSCSREELVSDVTRMARDRNAHIANILDREEKVNNYVRATLSDTEEFFHEGKEPGFWKMRNGRIVVSYGMIHEATRVDIIAITAVFHAFEVEASAQGLTQQELADKVADTAAAMEIDFIYLECNSQERDSVSTAWHERISKVPGLEDLDVIYEMSGESAGLTWSMIQTWTWLNRAKVFHLDPERYEDLTCEIGDYLGYHLGFGNAFQQNDGRTFYTKLQGVFDKDKISSDKVHDAFDNLENLSRAVPFPAPMPFECIFLGLGSGYEIHGEERAAVGHIIRHTESKRIWILGYLIVEEWAVLIVVQYEGQDGVLGSLNMSLYQGENGWRLSQFLAPWVLNGIIGAINEHRTILVEDKRGKRFRGFGKALKKKLKIHKLAPPDFYQIQLRSDVFIRSGQGRGPDTGQVVRVYRHRWDVRGHERCRVDRGLLPLDPQVKLRLQSRGYEVFETDPLDAETYHKVVVRGHLAKKRDEWMAVLSHWVKPHVRGPEEAPYIRSVRKLMDLAPLERGL